MRRGAAGKAGETDPALPVFVDVRQERRRRVSEKIELAIVSATKATKAKARM